MKLGILSWEGKMKKVRLLFPLALLPIVIVTASACGSNAARNMQWANPPAMSIDPNKEYTATIKTDLGDIEIQLFAKEAPMTVNNFVFLAQQGFYNGVKFHRVRKNFVIQSGDPTGTGSGGPGYEFADEKVTRDYVAGTLAMANSGPDTNGSQFFITLVDLSGRLPKDYTIFGLVTSGFNVVQNIGNVPVKANPLTGEISLPTADVHINTVSIEER
jgi:peptidylprolyl isomerase